MGAILLGCLPWQVHLLEYPSVILSSVPPGDLGEPPLSLKTCAGISFRYGYQGISPQVQCILLKFKQCRGTPWDSGCPLRCGFTCTSLVQDILGFKGKHIFWEHSLAKTCRLPRQRRIPPTTPLTQPLCKEFRSFCQTVRKALKSVISLSFLGCFSLPPCTSHVGLTLRRKSTLLQLDPSQTVPRLIQKIHSLSGTDCTNSLIFCSLAC